MSKKMQDIICCAICLIVFLSVGFAFIFALGAFVDNSLELSKVTRHAVVGVYAIICLGLIPLAISLGEHLSDAIEERWRD